MDDLDLIYLRNKAESARPGYTIIEAEDTLTILDYLDTQGYITRDTAKNG